MHQGRFRLDSRECFFTEGVARYWNRWPRAVMKSSSLEGLRGDVALGDTIYWWSWQYWENAGLSGPKGSSNPRDSVTLHHSLAPLLPVQACLLGLVGLFRGNLGCSAGWVWVPEGSSGAVLPGAGCARDHLTAGGKSRLKWMVPSCLLGMLFVPVLIVCPSLRDLTASSSCTGILSHPAAAMA